MKKLTAEVARMELENLKALSSHPSHGISIKSELFMQALEIALPVLKGRIANSSLPKEVFNRIYDQFLNGLVCGESNKSAAEGFLKACVIALHESEISQPKSTTDTYRQIENDGWIEWKGGLSPVSGDVVIEFKRRDGQEGSGESKYFLWHHDGNFDDIIAYRVIENDGREG